MRNLKIYRRCLLRDPNIRVNVRRRRLDKSKYDLQGRDEQYDHQVLNKLYIKISLKLNKLETFKMYCSWRNVSSFCMYCSWRNVSSNSLQKYTLYSKGKSTTRHILILMKCKLTILSNFGICNPQVKHMIHT